MISVEERWSNAQQKPVGLVLKIATACIQIGAKIGFQGVQHHPPVFRVFSGLSDPLDLSLTGLERFGVAPS